MKSIHPLLPLVLFLPHLARSFSMLQSEWISLKHKHEIIPPRSGHTSFRVGDQLYIFGGYAEEEDQTDNDDESLPPRRYATNDLWVWNNKDGWERVNHTGDIPGPRLVSAVAVIDGCPTVFGGWDPQTPTTGGIILDTIHQFHPSTQSWNTLDVRTPDGPTSRHICLSLPCQTRAILHNHRCVDHVWIFENNKFRKQSTTGSGPSSRGLHAATMLGDAMVVFGGAAQDGTMSDELFVLDTNSWVWKNVVSKGEKCPSPRAAPCLCTLNDNSVLVFGGAETTQEGLNAKADLWMFQFHDDEKNVGTWELVSDDDHGPNPRNAATLDEIDVPIELFQENKQEEDGVMDKCFLLQGGWKPFRKTWGENMLLRIRFRE